MPKFLVPLLVFLVVVLGFILRINQVTEVPPSLNWDEVSIGYNAYSVLKTGRDEWGQLLPIFFKSYGEYKLPVQIYGSIPAIAIFGLNDFGVRSTPVIYGTLTVLLMFFLGRALFKNKYIGLISAFLLAISPWHIHLTRGSFESSFALFWLSFGVWFLVKGFRNKKWWIISMTPFALGVYTYNSARIFIPLLLFVTLAIYFRDFWKNKTTTIVACLLFLGLIVPMVIFTLSGAGSARYKLVSVTDDPGLLPKINEQRGKSTLPQPLPRLVHNKITYIASIYITNYLAHFTPDFLFLNGAPHKQHHVQGIGQLYLFQAPFLLIGIWFIFKRKEKFRWLLAGWVLLGFVPVSVTHDSIPHALRTLVTVPAFQFFTAFGIYEAYLWIKKRSLAIKIFGIATFLIVVVVSIGLYLQNYYLVYPKLYSRDWQYGYAQVVDYIAEHKNEYDLIVFTRHYGEPHMFTLFYLNYDPAKFQNSPNLNRFETYDWIRVLRFDNFYFPDLGDKGTRYEDIIEQNPGKKILFIGRSGDFPEDKTRIKSIDFLNGDNAFDIVEVK